MIYFDINNSFVVVPLYCPYLHVVRVMNVAGEIKISSCVKFLILEKFRPTFKF